MKVMTTNLDLSQFCAKEKHLKYDMTRPFLVGPHVYATDGMIVVRIVAANPPLYEPIERAAPVEKLNVWNAPTDSLVPLPERLEFYIEDCGDCDGTGACMCGCPKCDEVCQGCRGRAVRARDFHFQGERFDFDKFAFALRDPALRIGIVETKSGMSLRFISDAYEGALMAFKANTDEAPS